MAVRSRMDSLQSKTMFRTLDTIGLPWDGGSGVFQLGQLRGDFGQGWRDDLRLLEARHDQRRDARPLDQGRRATGCAGADEIPRMRGDQAQLGQLAPRRLCDRLISL